jgi:hypothetical protein
MGPPPKRYNVPFNHHQKDRDKRKERCWWILTLSLLRSLMEHVYHVSSDGFVISATTMCMNVAIAKMNQSLNEANFVECDIRSVFKLQQSQKNATIIQRNDKDCIFVGAVF